MAAIVVIVGVTIGVLLQRRSHDDVHSVQHYHRQLHTLEEMRSHPPRPGGNGDGAGDGDGVAAHPSQAYWVGSSTVRLTDPHKPLVPPVAPPPVPNPARPLTFDDAGGGSVRPIGPGGPDADANGDADEDRDEPGSDADGEAEPKVPATARTAASTVPSAPAKGQERAMHSIDHRPRRLGAPLAAIGAVTILIVVLIVTGLHTTNSNSPHHGTAATVTTTSAAATHHSHGTHRATTTTAPPVVSSPSSATAQGATYQVSSADYSLALSATTGECWVQATNTGGAVLFSGVLLAGQSHTVSATGPVTVIAGAPNVFTATVDGSLVSLPAGFQAPFTLKFVSPGTGTGGGAGTGTTTGGTGTGAQQG
jgi:hypothetical protein